MTVKDPVLSRVTPLCLGGNVFGWTMDEAESFAVLDAYVGGGGNFLDTADAYSIWEPGHTGGESEQIIGNWLKSRGHRDQVVLATKFGQLLGVRADNVRAAVDASLRRLQTDYIDLYYAHIDDAEVPLEETLGVLAELVAAGKARAIGASGYSVDRLARALEVSDAEGFPRYVALQPLYNLMERDSYEGALQELCVRQDLACLPFFSLARGFLTGKYRPGAAVETKRGGFGWTGEWDDRSSAVLAALDAVAEAHGTTVAAAALAWLRAQPGVLAPIASARTPEQLRDLMPALDLELTADEVRRLTEASEIPA
jgi:aryl-alcohol dehydrogenase-like predicted oxidoreductase